VTTSEHHPLDDVAKALASGTVSRRQALKLIGASLVGAGLALIPGVAAAAPPEHAPPSRPGSTPNAGGYGTGGRFGKGGPLADTCSGIFCDPSNNDRDCPGNCLCSCPHVSGNFLCVAPGQTCP
jgi:hypothetical protein